jgi:transcriptional regulator with XRE-family HTH domain
MLTGEQIRAARALARMEQAQLASAAELSLPTIKRLEKTKGAISANISTESALRRTFDSVGVIFIDANGGGPGVRMKNNL